MASKATLRIPDWLLERLRARSREEGRSLNETAWHAIERGLGGEPPNESWRALGPWIEVPPTRSFDSVQVRRLRASLEPGARGLDEDLDWIRAEG